MDRSSLRSRAARHTVPRVIVSTACALSLLGVSQASGQPVGQSGQPTTPPSSSAGSATLEGCVTAVVQAERSATFSGEMTAVAGTVRMSMRIDVEERIPGEALFHTVSASGLGVWRASDPKVKVYKYLKQVTNLSSPASYRGLVRFRWQGPKGHVIKRAERLTTRCLQPASPAEPLPASPGASTTSSTSTSTSSLQPGAGA
jgi:hypothetical protein